MNERPNTPTVYNSLKWNFLMTTERNNASGGKERTARRGEEKLDTQGDDVDGWMDKKIF